MTVPPKTYCDIFHSFVRIREENVYSDQNNKPFRIDKVSDIDKLLVPLHLSHSTDLGVYVLFPTRVLMPQVPDHHMNMA